MEYEWKSRKRTRNKIFDSNESTFFLQKYRKLLLLFPLKGKLIRKREALTHKNAERIYRNKKKKKVAKRDCVTRLFTIGIKLFAH